MIDLERDQSERNRDAMTSTMLSHHMLKHKAFYTTYIVSNYFLKKALEVKIQLLDALHCRKGS